MPPKPLPPRHAGTTESASEAADPGTAYRRRAEALAAECNELRSIVHAFADMHFRLAADGAVLD